MESINDLLLTTIVIEVTKIGNENKKTETKQNKTKCTQTSKYNGTVNKINEYVVVGDVRY